MQTDLADLVTRALEEDVGTGDVTSAATVPETARAVATITQKAPGVVFGLDVAEAVFARLDPDAEIERLGPEGEWRESGPVLRVAGSARALLAAERTALNFLGRLSGVATLTARCVQAIEGTGAKVLDTRKTTPGLRALEKAAVRAGGGVNHRGSLSDFVLVKDNHLAGLTIAEAVRRAMMRWPGRTVEVECENLEQVHEAIGAGATMLLLDNKTPEKVAEAVGMIRGRAVVEVSGGITLDNAGAYAAAGADLISSGLITNSAPNLDIGLDLE